MNIAQVIPLPDFTLLIESDQGHSGIFDVQPYLNLEAFQALRNMDEFLKVQSGGYFVEWDCGADLSADTLFAQWQPRVQSAPPTMPSHTAAAGANP